jgi:hypothetical protein
MPKIPLYESSSRIGTAKGVTLNPNVAVRYAEAVGAEDSALKLGLFNLVEETVGAGKEYLERREKEKESADKHKYSLWYNNLKNQGILNIKEGFINKNGKLDEEEYSTMLGMNLETEFQNWAKDNITITDDIKEKWELDRQSLNTSEIGIIDKQRIEDEKYVTGKGLEQLARDGKKEEALFELSEIENLSASERRAFENRINISHQEYLDEQELKQEELDKNQIQFIAADNALILENSVTEQNKKAYTDNNNKLYELGYFGDGADALRKKQEADQKYNEKVEKNENSKKINQAQKIVIRKPNKGYSLIDDTTLSLEKRKEEKNKLDKKRIANAILNDPKQVRKDLERQINGEITVYEFLSEDEIISYQNKVEAAINKQEVKLNDDYSERIRQANEMEESIEKEAELEFIKKELIKDLDEDNLEESQGSALITKIDNIVNDDEDDEFSFEGYNELYDRITSYVPSEDKDQKIGKKLQFDISLVDNAPARSTLQSLYTQNISGEFKTEAYIRIDEKLKIIERPDLFGDSAVPPAVSFQVREEVAEHLRKNPNDIDGAKEIMDKILQPYAEQIAARIQINLIDN